MKLSVVVFFALWALTAQAQYFNEPVDTTLPSPQQTLGHAVGDWHARHDQIQRYFELLASRSDHAMLEVIGYTHEQRPLLQLVISSPDNLRRLDDIRQQHLAQAKEEKAIASDAPVVIWLGYGVHGNEPSAANASLVLAHYLTAVKTEEVTAWLDKAIILIQPSLNPDGHDRFALWANMHKGIKPVADPQHREHIEPWPNGRPNHYWFDLNRDWLLLQHPESQARIAQFQQWLPNVVGDFHEMGTNSSYFFQPGIPSRNYPLTPKQNFELTAAIAEFHAAAFDAREQLYYTEESFDDFYVGKGSTYPDVNGSIGILFEQASSRGHLQESINGLLSFRDTIHNQFTASLSTIRGAVAKRTDLLQYQQQFYQNALSKARADKVKGYMLLDDGDKSRLHALLDLLQRHHIAVYPLNRDWQDDDTRYLAGKSYFVPLQQAQYLLIKAAFSTEKNFKDNTFYDVSSWTLPYAYNIEFKAVSREPGRALASGQWQFVASPKQPLPAGAYAYAFNWQDQQAPLLLQALLTEELVVRSALRSFSGQTHDGTVQFQPGAMMIAAGLQQHSDWFARLQRLQQQYPIQIHAIRTGLTPEGSDLGSHNFAVINKPEVLLIAGPGINSTEAGEVWYNLERLAGISPSMVEPERLRRINLSRYTHIILPDGNYRQWQDGDIAQLKQWAEQGGVLWGHKGGAAWLAKVGLLQAGVWQSSDMQQLIPQQNLNYADREALSARQRIAGAIFSAELDLSHPLTFGIPRASMPLFKNSTLLLQPSNAPFINVGLYSKDPHLAGFTASEYVPKIAQGAALLAHNLGRGRVVGMTDNPVFRGYFFGSSRILVNAMYLGNSFNTPLQAE
ncbi:peptidase M14 [Arsukibacterium ikkense]|uniref:Peptidase M14 n=1 Tax=Arsukibacterium ikkense TaxID=336831 RepID=A0A0M2V1Z2_9GAMM|nr:M14 family zinc carboxypeptidase [Arsukibacterium ikkense]KKO44646.1 peptidase M14 [Arsukibacterium ikkense]